MPFKTRKCLARTKSSMIAEMAGVVRVGLHRRLLTLMCSRAIGSSEGDVMAA